MQKKTVFSRRSSYSLVLHAFCGGKKSVFKCFGIWYDNVRGWFGVLLCGFGGVFLILFSME